MVFMTAAFVTGGDMTIIVTTGSRIFSFQAKVHKAHLCANPSVTTRTMPRRPAEVGFILTIAILFIPYLQLQQRLPNPTLTGSQAYIAFLTSLRRPKVRPKRLVLPLVVTVVTEAT